MISETSRIPAATKGAYGGSAGIFDPRGPDAPAQQSYVKP